MKLITYLNQHELGYTSQSDEEISYIRKASRAVMTNKTGQIALMHFTKTGSYKLPGGGVDEGESYKEALVREMLEETGYEISNIRNLGVVEEDRYYCGMHQTSYCFTVDAERFAGTSLTEKEEAEGMKLMWFDSIAKAISAIETNNTTDEDGSEIGLRMMTLRESAVLKAALKE